MVVLAMNMQWDVPVGCAAAELQFAARGRFLPVTMAVLCMGEGRRGRRWKRGRERRGERGCCCRLRLQCVLVMQL